MRDGSRWAAASVTAVLLGVVFLVFWVATGRSLPNPDGSPAPWLEPLVTMIVYGLAGALLVDRRPDLPFGWLLSGTAVLVAVEVLVVAPAHNAVLEGNRHPAIVMALTAGTLGFLPVATQGLINIRFPSGKPIGRFGRVFEKVLVVSIGGVVLGGVLGTSTIGDLSSEVGGLQNPLTSGTAVSRIADVLVFCAPFVVLLGLIAGIGVVIRFFRAEGIARQQLKWRATGVVVSLALFPLAVTDRLPFFDASLDTVVFVLTLVVPVLRYRLWSIDTILRRSSVYGVITAALVITFAVVSSLGAQVMSRQDAAPIAAVLVAVSFVPLRERVQRLLDRLFYGGRQDPYLTLRTLGRRLNDGADLDHLAAFSEAVASTLRLPYVAVQSADGTPVAAYGSPVEPLERWPLTYEGQVEGYLLASARRGEDSFDERDRDLLTDVAGQLGPAVRAGTLTAELLRSRQQLVTAREEERRRLRQELHDGLGPVLTAIGLTLDAARARVDTDPDSAHDHLGDARDAVHQALTDLRKVVHGLRPPALDDLGLVGALRSHSERLAASSPVRITVEASDVPHLPAAVEVAVYRTAVEAITNVVRHSDARTCSVRLTATPTCLEIGIDDDGTSTGPWLPGVGIMGMRDRAAELGGSCQAAPGPRGGSVTARFPLAEPS